MRKIELIKLYELEDEEPTGPLWGLYAKGFHNLDDFALAIAEECCCDWEFTDLEIEDHEEDGNYDDKDRPFPHLLNHIKLKTIQRWFKETDYSFNRSASFVLGSFPGTCYVHN